MTPLLRREVRSVSRTRVLQSRAHFDSIPNHNNSLGPSLSKSLAHAILGTLLVFIGAFNIVTALVTPTQILPTH